MAAIVDVIKKTKFLGSFAVIANVTLDSSYATGGEPLTASQFGLGTIEFVLPATSGGYVFEYDHANNKLKAYVGGAAVSVAMAQVANAVNLSAVTVRVMAIGI